MKGHAGLAREPCHFCPYRRLFFITLAWQPLLAADLGLSTFCT